MQLQIISSHQLMITSIIISKFKRVFLKWIHFIHNKINKQIGKEEISYIEFVNNYNNEYKPKDIKFKEKIKEREKYVFALLFTILIAYSIYNINNM